MIQGIDSSHWQNAMTTAALQAYKPQFAVGKATEGSTYQDPDFRKHFALWQAYGVPVLGAYHRLRHGNIDGQLRNFRGVIADPRGLVIQVDIEDNDVTYQDVVDWYAAWNHATNNYPCVLYTGDWFWEGKHWGDGSKFGPLWAAPDRGYVGSRFTDSDWHAGYGGWTNLSIAQYATNGVLGDLDYYNGTLDQFRAQFTRDGQGAPVPTLPSEVTHTYQVKPGESLWLIAQHLYGHGDDFPIIADANNIRAPYVIHAGDVLVIPAHVSQMPPPENSRKYTVQPGDTLSHIALLYYGAAGDWRRIFNANRGIISNPNVIQPKWVLSIP